MSKSDPTRWRCFAAMLLMMTIWVTAPTSAHATSEPSSGDVSETDESTPDSSAPDATAPPTTDPGETVIGGAPAEDTDATALTWIAIVAAVALVGVAVWWMARTTDREPPTRMDDDWPSDSELI